MKKILLYMFYLAVVGISIPICSMFFLSVLPEGSLTELGESNVEIVTGKIWGVNLFVCLFSFYSGIKALQKL